MNLLEGYVYSKDDTKIFINKDIPSSCKCIVVIAHGYMEHSRRYIAFAEYLVANQMGVCLIDHRGNGNSDGEEGDIKDFFLFVEDLDAVIKSLAVYDKPIITFGHSMGGLITFLYGLKYKDSVIGQIFSSPALGVPIGCKNIPPVLYECIAHLPGLKIHSGGDELSVRNKEYIQLFKNDPYRNDYSTGRFMDQFLRIGVHYASSHAEEYEKPALFLLGEKDHVIPIDRNQAILEKITFKEKTVKIYPDCMHDLLHDLEPEVDKMQKDIIDWIKSLISGIN